jgi:hypothetical protein
VGRKKIESFETTTVSSLRLTVAASAANPIINNIKWYNVKDYVLPIEQKMAEQWTTCGNWDTKTFKAGIDTIEVDCSFYIQQPGQYEIKFVQDVAITGTSVKEAILTIDNQNTMQSYLTRKGYDVFYINRTSQISNNSSTKIKFIMHSDNASFQNRGRFIIRKRTV